MCKREKFHFWGTLLFKCTYINGKLRSFYWLSYKKDCNYIRFPNWDLWLTFQKLKLHIFACNVDREKLQMSSLCEKLVIDSIMFCDYNLGSYFNQIQSFSKKYGIGLFLVKTISPLSNWHLWINYFFLQSQANIAEIERSRCLQTE